MGTDSSSESVRVGGVGMGRLPVGGCEGGREGGCEGDTDEGCEGVKAGDWDGEKAVSSVAVKLAGSEGVRV